jgi:atypical dual specificity phosphatase
MSSTDRWARWKSSLLWAPTLGWNGLLGRVLRIRQWWSWVDDQVLLGGYPFARDVPTLQQLGIHAVINMCDEYPGPKEAYRCAAIEQLYLPTIDFTHPTLESVQQGVAFLQSQVAEDRKVYVHCKAGRARSATIVLCWLVRHRGFTPQQAQAHLLRIRPHVNARLLDRPVVRKYLGLTG